MELIKAIENRRSIRHYNEKELSKDTITKILEAGRLSPSAHNRQPWHFIVIHEDKKKKEEISNILRASSEMEVSLTCDVIKECSALILVFGSIEDEIMDIQSIGASIENIILRAHDLKVGSLWIGYILRIEKELQQMFSTDNKLVAAIALGYTDTNPKARPRKSLEEITEWH